jgi:hypothetical protein
MRCLSAANSSMKQLAVEPVPTPMISPSMTWAMAARATACFSSSRVMVIFAMGDGTDIVARRWRR